MRNRSISSLPAFFAPAVSRSLSDQEARPGPLEVVDITFLHFHASMELGVCESGQGVCIVEGREYPFKAGDTQLIFPFQRHLSRSEGPQMSRWYWLNLDPIRLLGKWGAPELQRLETLMRESDLVSLHVPSNAQTRGLISRALLESMKPTAVLINTARGAVVDNAALADCLNAGKLSAAGIDVFDMEPPLPQDYPLLHAKNTVLAPHVAFATDESMLRRAEIDFRNVDAFLAGKPENVCKL